jgi:hypothetical protein
MTLTCTNSLLRRLMGRARGAGKEVAEVHGVARCSMGVIWAMISKSLYGAAQ